MTWIQVYIRDNERSQVGCNKPDRVFLLKGTLTLIKNDAVLKENVAHACQRNRTMACTLRRLLVIHKSI